MPIGPGQYDPEYPQRARIVAARATAAAVRAEEEAALAAYAAIPLPLTAADADRTAARDLIVDAATANEADDNATLQTATGALDTYATVTDGRIIP